MKTVDTCPQDCSRGIISSSKVLFARFFNKFRIEWQFEKFLTTITIFFRVKTVDSCPQDCSSEIINYSKELFKSIFNKFMIVWQFGKLGQLSHMTAVKAVSFKSFLFWFWTKNTSLWMHNHFSLAHILPPTVSSLINH